MAEQSKLAPLEPTTRQDIEAVHELTSAIMQEIDAMPHNSWRRVERLVSELVATFDEKLPGGFADQCDGCNTPLGAEDDFSTSEDVTICADCAANYEAEQQSFRGHTRAEGEAREIIAADGTVLKSPVKEPA